MTKQLEFKKTKGWGGKRRGAGRPNKSGLVSHAKREKVDFKKPLHITMRLKSRVADLRSRQLLREFKMAAQECKKFGFYLVHFSLLENHVHMIVEAKDNSSLARGMRSLGCRFGKAVRRLTGGAGAVFAGRFHLHVLKTPTEVKRALEYVLLNEAKHRKLIEYFDAYSSACTFKHWRKLLGNKWHGTLDHVKIIDFDQLSPPRSWLLSVGWRRAG